MRQRELEMFLQRVPNFSEPKAKLEQYMTPPAICADILYIAHAHADIQGLLVGDLGCGTGIFAIGAYLLGAKRVVAIDIDDQALALARKSAVELLELEDVSLDGSTIDEQQNEQHRKIVFEQKNIAVFNINVDTIFQNPPFGAQKKGAFKPFLENAMKYSNVVYSLHPTTNLSQVRRLIAANGAEISLEKRYQFPLHSAFHFHAKSTKMLEVVLLRINSNAGIAKDYLELRYH